MWVLHVASFSLHVYGLCVCNAHVGFVVSRLFTVLIWSFGLYLCTAETIRDDAGHGVSQS